MGSYLLLPLLLSPSCSGHNLSLLEPYPFLYKVSSVPCVVPYGIPYSPAEHFLLKLNVLSVRDLSVALHTTLVLQSPWQPALPGLHSHAGDAARSSAHGLSASLIITLLHQLQTSKATP